MKTVVSKTGIEVIYPCSVHLLTGEILECEYKSDQTGQELMSFICDHLGFFEKDFWGFTFLDCFEQRHWLDLSKLIRTQVKNVCPIHLRFRVKVYPPEPYKLEEHIKKHIFLQLWLDLKSGRLCCGISDASLLLGLILQFQLGDFNPELHFGNYVKEKFLQHQTFAIEMKAILFHKDHLSGINKDQTIDLFLRLSSQLETYGVDPFLVEDVKKRTMTLWINFKGMDTFVDAERIHHLEWMAITRIKQDERSIFVHLTTGDVVEFICLTKGECGYIYENAVDHLKYFTTSGNKSTTGIIGSESAEDLEEEIKSIEMNEENEENLYSSEVDFPQFAQKIELSVPWSKLLASQLGKWKFAFLGIFLAICLEIIFYNSYDIRRLDTFGWEKRWKTLIKAVWNK